MKTGSSSLKVLLVSMSVCGINTYYDDLDSTVKSRFVETFDLKSYHHTDFD
jgi:hypothetical protein